MGSYSNSQKFIRNGVTHLDEPAVESGNQSVIAFENCYISELLKRGVKRMVVEEKTQKEKEHGTAESGGADECASIEDPVRRGLCKVCQAPVIGEAPFCKDHEPPVP
jgi:hypothetical protein